MAALWKPSFRQPLVSLLSTAVDSVLPPRCLSCGVIVSRESALCPTCWNSVSFIATPYCACCGVPFEFESEADVLCGGCIKRPPAYSHARSVMRYDDASRRLVLGFKHSDRTHAARQLGAWMARAGAELAENTDIILPVPLHWRRFVRRRYNQSALLAKSFSKSAGLKMIPDGLMRKRATPSQGRLSPAQRRRNVRGAFAIHPRHARAIAGSNILLIDDVFTTGATVEACTRTLTKGGASTVSVLTLARVVRPISD